MLNSEIKTFSLFYMIRFITGAHVHNHYYFDIRMYNFARVVNLGGENVCNNIFCGNFFFSCGSWKKPQNRKTYLTRKNLVPHGIVYQIITFSERCTCNGEGGILLPLNVFFPWVCRLFKAYFSFAFKTFYNVTTTNRCTQPCEMESKISDFDCMSQSVFRG